MAIWAYFCVPETKGRTLESMDQLFGAESVSYENELTEDEIQEKSSAFHREGLSGSVENKA